MYNVKTKNWAVIDRDEDRARVVTIYRIYKVYYTADIGAKRARERELPGRIAAI